MFIIRFYGVRLIFVSLLFLRISIAILEFCDPTVSHKHIFNNNDIISAFIRSCKYSINPSHKQKYKGVVILKYTMNHIYDSMTKCR